ncbi:hypothetical protein EZJ19_15095 [Parasulfuritortus cantonensis]|uniref:Uncharacterized protein n=1 Tax=Parasulfuritortus cantonensis TaxID=2528202 RepID=A0A4R1B5Y3_9PROT|nr:hypothetical protein [Parasulfuritortus cantonensis]TCJ11598.1 hypothetical protein EZJ19_15095 [Parasulfuritortus cantonensis]
MSLLYSLVGSPLACRFPDLYAELGIEMERFDTARNLHRALKQRVPDFFVGEFVYGWGNNYAGANVSNLDVTLRTLQAVAPRARLIIVMQPSEAAHVDKLLELFPVHAVLTYPIGEADMRAALRAAG